MTLAKFCISSYSTQITCSDLFSKIPVLMCINFSNSLGERTKIAISAVSLRQKWPEIVHFIFARTDQGDDICHYTLACS